MMKEVTVRPGWTPFKPAIIDFKDGDFPTLLGSPHVLQSGVMPVIVVRVADGVPRVRVIGTCFCISSLGLVATASHVVEEAFKIMGYSPDLLRDSAEHHFISSSNEWLLGVIYWSNIIPTEIAKEREHHGGFLRVTKMWPLSRGDLAVMRLEMMIYKPTNELIFMPALPLSPAIPEPESLCFGYGYHSSDWQPLYTDNEWKINVSHTFSCSKGHVTEVYFPLRDTVLLSFPSFATSARFEAGMSGGPILNEHGSVVGIISVGLKTEEPGFIGYGTLSAQLLFIELEVGTDPIARKFLFEWDGVAFDRTINRINIKKTPEDVVLDFGNGRVLRLLRRQSDKG